jgi:hypothetical protein
MRLGATHIALPLVVALAACGGGSEAPMEPGKAFAVSVSGPATAQGNVLLDLADTTRVTYRCDYPVTLRAEWGSTGEAARWLGGSFDLTSLPGSSVSFHYSTLIPATAVPGYVGATQLVSGQYKVATLSTWLTFPRSQPSVGTIGAHHARWAFTYTTSHMSGSATAVYEVDCLPTTQ